MPTVRSDLMYRPEDHYSPMPNVIWGLELSPGAIATYGYLLFRENRKTYKCYPSFEDIGRAIGRSKRSVPEYVAELVDKKLIEVKNTTVTLSDGTKNNGTLEYHILNPMIAVKHYNDNYEARAVQKAQKSKKPRPRRELRTPPATTEPTEDFELPF